MYKSTTSSFNYCGLRIKQQDKESAMTEQNPQEPTGSEQTAIDQASEVAGDKAAEEFPKFNQAQLERIFQLAGLRYESNMPDFNEVQLGFLPSEEGFGMVFSSNPDVKILASMAVLRPLPIFQLSYFFCDRSNGQHIHHKEEYIIPITEESAGFFREMYSLLGIDLSGQWVQNKAEEIPVVEESETDPPQSDDSRATGNAEI